MRVDYTLREIGDACRQFRKRLGYTQIEVAIDTGYTSSNVSHFENGLNDNIKLLMWYIDHGFSIGFLDDYVKITREEINGEKTFIYCGYCQPDKC